MTFDEFMSLEKNDGVVYNGRSATVTDVKNFVKGNVYYLQGMRFQAQHTMRQLEVSYYDRKKDKVVRRYPLIYVDAIRGEVHNTMVLSATDKWDPFSNLEAAW